MASKWTIYSCQAGHSTGIRDYFPGTSRVPTLLWAGLVLYCSDGFWNIVWRAFGREETCFVSNCNLETVMAYLHLAEIHNIRESVEGTPSLRDIGLIEWACHVRLSDPLLSHVLRGLREPFIANNFWYIYILFSIHWFIPIDFNCEPANILTLGIFQWANQWSMPLWNFLAFHWWGRAGETYYKQ